MLPRHTFNLLFYVFVCVLLAGCAVGRTYDYKQFPVQLPVAQVASQRVSLAVHDRRPYVVSGAKPESFVGIRRGGFGNPFDMNTSGRVPFADDFREALAKPLQVKGYHVTAVRLAPSDSASTVRQKVTAAGQKTILISLAEWKTDILRSTDLHYDVMLAIVDEKGETVATKAVKGMDPLGPSGREGLERAFSRKFDELFEDEKIAAALK
jgi:hypothetical protein